VIKNASIKTNISKSSHSNTQLESGVTDLSQPQPIVVGVVYTNWFAFVIDGVESAAFFNSS
jgi:hypothetical protein